MHPNFSEIRYLTKKGIEFNQLGVFNVLLSELGFNCIKFETKERFLKSILGGFKVVGFRQLIDEYKMYLDENFQRNTLPIGMMYEDIENAFYKSKPITKNYARGFFSHNKRLNESDFVLKEELLMYK